MRPAIAQWRSTSKNRRRAVPVMQGEEGPCLREADGPQFELPVQHGMAALAVADPAQAMAGECLDAKPAQQVAPPDRVLVHAG